MSKLKLDLHPIYNKNNEIEKALAEYVDNASENKIDELEIICGKGSGQLKKRVIRFLEQKDTRTKYHRYKKDAKNWGRIFVYFR